MRRTVTVKTRRSAATSQPTHDQDNEENVGDDDEEDVGECVVMYRLPRYLRVHSSWHLAPSATQFEYHHHRHCLLLHIYKWCHHWKGVWVNQKMNIDDRETSTYNLLPSEQYFVWLRHYIPKAILPNPTNRRHFFHYHHDKKVGVEKQQILHFFLRIFPT